MVGRSQCNSRSDGRRGSVMIYALLAITPLMALGTLSVDLGRIQTAKSELQDATDAAARYAAWGMRSTMLGASGATANATVSFADCRVDGQLAPFNAASDLDTGIWVPLTRTFTPTTVALGANAVRLRTKLTLGTPAHPLPFLSMFGRLVTVNAQSIAMIKGQDASTYVSARGNPWLAGVPAGGVSSDFRSDPSEQDTAGSAPNLLSSPAMVGLAGLNMTGGGTLTFDGVTGGTNFGPDPVTTSADGDPSRLINLGSPGFGSTDYFTSPMNGMSNCHAPINAMMAVFLDDTDPRTTPAPTTPLDFSTTVSRNYLSLAPKLKQVFFIGDGRRDNGEIQQITVPPGATRMFIANMDGWQYNNNVGGYNLTIHANQAVTSVLLR